MKRFEFLIRAYQGLNKLSLLKSTLSVLKSLLDPAMEGSPYTLESDNNQMRQTKNVPKSFFSLKRMSWR